jgi:hypothetical protein
MLVDGGHFACARLTGKWMLGGNAPPRFGRSARPAGVDSRVMLLKGHTKGPPNMVNQALPAGAYAVHPRPMHTGIEILKINTSG